MTTLRALFSSAALLGALLAPTPLSAPFGFRPGDLERLLRELSDGDAVVRGAAERQLATELTRSDFPAIADAIRAGSAEVRARLALALSSDDRHLGLAALCASDTDVAVAAVGARAIEELYLAWNPTGGDRAARLLPHDWTDESSLQLALGIGVPVGDDRMLGDLSAAVSRLARFGGGPATIVLDPGLDPGALRPGLQPVPLEPGADVLSGTWPELIEKLTDRHRVAFDVLGHRQPGEALARRARAWVRICKRGDQGETNSITYVLEWCRAVLAVDDVADNTAAARALASLGWPAAVQWLEELWLEGGGRAPFEGLLSAAGRGRVAPAFAEPTLLRVILGELDGELETRAPGSVPRAERCARALAELGPTGPRGEVLADVLLEGFDELPAPAQWVRLVALEGQGTQHAGASQKARALLASNASPVLRLQALRALGRSGARGGAVAVGEAEALLEYAAEQGSIEVTVRLLGAVQAAWPAQLERSSAFDRSPAMRRALFSWALAAGDSGAADRLFDGIAERGELAALADAMRLWAGLGRGDELRAWLARGTNGGAGRAPRLALLELDAGLASEARVRAELDRLLLVDARGPEELYRLACLAAAPGVGWRARELLVEGARGGLSAEDLLAAWDRAAAGLARARLDEEGLLLFERVGKAAREAGHPAALALSERPWPPPLTARPILLDALDRRLGR